MWHWRVFSVFPWLILFAGGSVVAGLHVGCPLIQPWPSPMYLANRDPVWHPTVCLENVQVRELAYHLYRLFDKSIVSYKHLLMDVSWVVRLQNILGVTTQDCFLAMVTLVTSNLHSRHWFPMSVVTCVKIGYLADWCHEAPETAVPWCPLAGQSAGR